MLVCNIFMRSSQNMNCGPCIAQSCICRCLQRTCQVYYFLISVALMQTTPPCSEGLRWFVFDTPLEIGIDYMEKFQAKLGEFYVRLTLPVRVRHCLRRMAAARTAVWAGSLDDPHKQRQQNWI